MTQKMNCFVCFKDKKKFICLRRRKAKAKENEKTIAGKF